ncbi:MAG: hypothetical protein IJS97_01790 [Prevotella sp.]|nr:hypothetical protein [Prevotella sp.]
MKNVVLIQLAALMLIACSPNADKQANELMAEIEQLYNNKQFKQALDSIETLRQRFPRAVEARKRALEIWDNASLQMAQADIAKTDSAFLATENLIQNETDIYKRNMLGVRRDSLKARYEALCGVVKMIRHRQK